jgi:FlaA1/EpsC-like NDP-sugar epimerase
MRVVVTGAGGFVGRHLVRRLLAEADVEKVVAVSRDEGKMQRLSTLCAGNARLVPLLGDIVDPSTARYVTRGADVLFHLAAMKHLDICERQPDLCVAVNVSGTWRLLESFRGRAFVFLSTDKAVEATSVYGCSKRIGEALVLQAADEPESRRIVVRSGNVWASDGSVVPRWVETIAQHGQVRVTDPEMRRWFIHAADLVDYLVAVVRDGATGKVYVPDLRRVRIGDLAQAVLLRYGREGDEWRTVGAGPGEKHEEALSIPGEPLGVLPGQVGHRDLTPEELDGWLAWYDRYRG